MTENEKRLEKALAEFDYMVPEDVSRAARALLAEHRAEVERSISEERAKLGAIVADVAARARDAALEEARDTFPTGGVFSGEAVRGILRELSTSATTVVPLEKVRDVLTDEATAEHAPDELSAGESFAWAHGYNAALRNARRAIGVDIDAKGDGSPTCCVSCRNGIRATQDGVCRCSCHGTRVEP